MGIEDPVDTVSLSREAIVGIQGRDTPIVEIPVGLEAPIGMEDAIGAEGTDGEDSRGTDEPSEERVGSASGDDSGEESEGDSKLSAEDEEVVREMKARDVEVRRHENAHASVGGRYAGTPRYDFQTGPDGKRYAVGGSVSIDVSAVPGDPEKTIEKMRVVRAAALAPAEPSGQDRRVAAEASETEAAARAEMAKQKSAEQASGTSATEGTDDAGAAGDTSEASDASSAATERVGASGARELAHGRRVSNRYRQQASSMHRAPSSMGGSLVRATA